MPYSDSALTNPPESEQPAQVATPTDTKASHQKCDKTGVKTPAKIFGSECSICRGICRAVISTLCFPLLKFLLQIPNQNKKES